MIDYKKNIACVALILALALFIGSNVYCLPFFLKMMKTTGINVEDLKSKIQNDNSTFSSKTYFSEIKSSLLFDKSSGNSPQRQSKRLKKSNTSHHLHQNAYASLPIDNTKDVKQVFQSEKQFCVLLKKQLRLSAKYSTKMLTTGNKLEKKQ